MKNKGITLVALVVTMIVLLILAVASINYALGENSLIKQAIFGSEKYTNSKQDEENKLYSYMEIVDSKGEIKSVSSSR